MAFDKISTFHPNPQVRRMREHGSSSQADSHADNEGKHGAEEHETPAKAVELHRHEDGSYHSITHHADGKKEKTEHGSHEEAMGHAKSAFGEDGDQMQHEGGDEGMQSEEQEPCPECGGEGCEACSGTGIKKSDGEEY
jgi:hypothetical protein